MSQMMVSNGPQLEDDFPAEMVRNRQPLTLWQTGNLPSGKLT